MNGTPMTNLTRSFASRRTLYSKLRGGEAILDSADNYAFVTPLLGHIRPLSVSAARHQR